MNLRCRRRLWQHRSSYGLAYMRHVFHSTASDLNNAGTFSIFEIWSLASRDISFTLFRFFFFFFLSQLHSHFIICSLSVSWAYSLLCIFRRRGYDVTDIFFFCSFSILWWVQFLMTATTMIIMNDDDDRRCNAWN